MGVGEAWRGGRVLGVLCLGVYAWSSGLCGLARRRGTPPFHSSPTHGIPFHCTRASRTRTLPLTMPHAHCSVESLRFCDSLSTMKCWHLLGPPLDLGT